MLVIHYSLGFGYSDIICWVPLKPQLLLNWRKNGDVIALIVGLKANNSCRRCDFTVLGTCLLLLCGLSRTCDEYWLLQMRGCVLSPCRQSLSVSSGTEDISPLHHDGSVSWMIHCLVTFLQEFRQTALFYTVAIFLL